MSDEEEMEEILEKEPYILESEEFSVMPEESSSQVPVDNEETLVLEDEFPEQEPANLTRNASEEEFTTYIVSNEEFLLNEMEKADAKVLEYEKQLDESIAEAQTSIMDSMKSSYLDLDHSEGSGYDNSGSSKTPESSSYLTNSDTSGYSFGSNDPKSIESLFKLIDPDREVDFNSQIDLLNQQIASMQHEICTEHKLRLIKQVRRFQFDKKLILNAISEAGILYLPGNFLEPITGRRIDDQDIPVILEALNELPETEFKGFNFAYNRITDEGITTLAPFIQERSHIIHLNLSHNDFTANGLHVLVTYLISRASLQTLKLTGAKVGDEGINSITCLYMCGKGPRDLDVSETDMTTPGFQALCSAFQAVDEDDDSPKFLTKYKLPFSLETLARLKMENHEFLKSQTYHRLCHSQFELLPQREKDRQIDEINQQLYEKSADQGEDSENDETDQGLSELLENAFTTSIFEGGDEASRAVIDLNKEAEMSIEITEKAKELPAVEDLIEAHKNMKDTGCKSAQPDGRPVIVCPSLYSLEVDEFNEETEGEPNVKSGSQALKKVNPMYMDTLVEPVSEQDKLGGKPGKEVVDNLTAERTSVKFVREVFKEAGSVAGISGYAKESDKAQLLLMTIFETAKIFLRAETDSDVHADLTTAELKMIWEHSLQTIQKIFRPSVPAHCKIKDETMGVFVEEFMKISCGTFYNLIQIPFFQDMFETAATGDCVESTKAKAFSSPPYNPTPLDMSYHDCVRNIILKFLEKIIVHAADIVGGGDPCSLRRTSPSSEEDDKRSSANEDKWPSLINMNEEMIAPLVDQLFDVGGLIAQDAITFKEGNEIRQNEGIEPAKQYLEGIFKQLANCLYIMKDDDKKLAERMEKPVKKFTFSTKPVRIVLNRPFFRGQEEIMASKLATYLRGNDSVQCLHLRKWGLGEDGTVNLMSGIITQQNIVTLDLALNGIGTEGMHAIAEYIKRNQNLKHLLLNHNRLRNPGMIVLADAIPESSLISLNVAYNDATEDGVNPLLEALGKSDIYSLYILGNCLSQTSCTLIVELFDSKSLNQINCDIEIQDVDGEKIVAINSQARDLNEWYEVPVKVDLGLVCPPYYMEHYTPPKVSIFGAVDVEV